MRLPASKPSPVLVLFDIDGTLLRRAGPHHRQVLVDAAFRVTGVPVSIDGLPVHGMLDRDILAMMLTAAGASQRTVRTSMAEMVALAQRLYVRRCPDLSRKLTPGARSVLSRLARARIPTGLVTGNLSRIGWRKMDRAGIRPYFGFGAFAEQGRTRAALARQAIAHAQREGLIARDARIWLIGDHPNDIVAARANGIGSVAVATGLCGPEELAHHQPDLLLNDLRELRLDHLRGEPGGVNS